MAHKKNKKKIAATGSVVSINIFNSKIYSLVLISILGILIYSNSFQCSLHFDDLQNIMNNKAIRDLNELKDIWNFNFQSKLRFIGFLTFALNFHFNGLHVFGYHLVNMLIHLAASWCVWWLVMLILSGPVMAEKEISRHKNLIALGCGLLFVSHPIQTQAVTYIVQRFASLSSFFYLASLCCYLKARLTVKNSVSLLYFTGSFLSALLGMFTKEIVFTLPFALLLFEFSFIRTESLKKLIKKKSTFLYVVPLLFTLIIPAIIWLDWSISSLFLIVQSDRYLDPPFTNKIYLMTQFRVLPAYIRLLFFPLHLNLDHDFPASRSFFEMSTMAGFVFLLVLFGTALWIFPKRKLEAVGILWFFLTLSVESSIIILKNVMFEHRLYLPMFGFSLFFVSMLYDLLWEKHSKAAIIIFMGVIIFNSILTYERNKAWKDDFTLWSDVVKKSPNKARPYNNLGNALFRQGKIHEAIEEYQMSLQVNPRFAMAINNLANALSMEKKYDEALMNYKKALLITPSDTEIYINIATTYILQGSYDKALAALRDALAINPNHVKAHINLGDVLYHEERYEEAIEEYRTALHLEPNDPDIYNNLGSAFYRLERYDEAKAAYHNALAVNPNFSKTYNNLGIISYHQGKYEESVGYYRKALNIDPNYTIVHVNLGDVLIKLGKTAEAAAAYRQALRLEPNHIRAIVGLGDALYDQGKVKDAAAAYNKALRIDPNSVYILYKLGIAYKTLGEPDWAAVHLKRALALEPGLKEAQDLLHIILLEQGSTR